MALEQKVIVEQIEGILTQCTSLVFGSKYDDFSDLPEERISEAVNLLFAAIARLSPLNSVYAKNAEEYKSNLRTNLGRSVAPLMGILRAVKADYAGNRLQSVAELVHAEMFDDFLEMAEHLGQQGYKDAEAVIVGSVLEGHLRELCRKHGISTVQSGTPPKPKKADALNSELAAASAYSKLDQKSVTAWLDLRNKAAHGSYAEYSKEQVELMLQGVRDFLSRHPA